MLLARMALQSHLIQLFNIGMREQRTKEATSDLDRVGSPGRSPSAPGCQGDRSLQLSGVGLGYLLRHTKGSATRVPFARDNDHVLHSWGSCRLFWERFSSWQIQIHSMGQMAVFPEPVRDRYLQLKERGTYPTSTCGPTSQQSCPGMPVALGPPPP